MITVHVDVVRPGRALITGPNFSGYVWRQDNTLYVEDTDTEVTVGTAASCRAAGWKLATHHGLADVTVIVEWE